MMTSTTMRDLRSDEVDAIAGGKISFSIGFISFDFYGHDPEGHYGLGPKGVGTDLPLAAVATGTQGHAELF